MPSGVYKRAKSWKLSQEAKDKIGKSNLGNKYAWKGGK